MEKMKPEEKQEKLSLPSSAYSVALGVYAVLCDIESIFILRQCINDLPKQWTLKQLLIYSTERRSRAAVRELTGVKLLRIEKIGKLNYYTLNHDRLELINGSAARLL